MNFGSDDLIPYGLGSTDATAYYARRPFTFRFFFGGEPARRIRYFSTTGFRDQYRDREAGTPLATVYQEMCGERKFREGIWFWTYLAEGDDEEDRIEGGGGFTLTYDFHVSTGPGDPHSVTLVEETTGDLDLAAFPVRKKILSPSGGSYVVTVDDRHQTVGYLQLSGEVTLHWLKGQAREWSEMDPDFREATGGYEDPMVWETQTLSGRYITCGVGHIRFPVDLTPDIGDYQGHSSPVKVRHLIDRRSCVPALYEEHATFGWRGNQLYRKGSSLTTLEDPITDQPWKDNFGIYGLEGDFRALALASINWQTGYSLDSLIIFPGQPSRIEVGMFASRDGRRYRVNVQAGHMDPAWVVDEEILVVVDPANGPATFEFDRAATVGISSQVRVIEISIPDGDGGWNAIATYPDAADHIGTNLNDPEVWLLTGRKSRYGERWGHPPFEGDGPWYRKKKLVRKARAISGSVTPEFEEDSKKFTDPYIGDFPRLIGSYLA
jgi:hypothetical protein